MAATSSPSVLLTSPHPVVAEHIAASIRASPPPDPTSCPLASVPAPLQSSLRVGLLSLARRRPIHSTGMPIHLPDEEIGESQEGEEGRQPCTREELGRSRAAKDDGSREEETYSWVRRSLILGLQFRSPVGSPV
nr:unnamed protein product [Digitaria exilis]